MQLNARSAIAGGLACLLWLSSCLPSLGQDSAVLARNVCGSCHLFPEPGLLDRRTWVEGVLPEMGARLGFQSFRGGPVRPGTDAPEWVYPSDPAISEAHWESIVAWYEDEAPERLDLPVWQERSRLELFTLEALAAGGDGLPVTTAVFIDEANRLLLMGDSVEMNLKTYGPDLSYRGALEAVGLVSRIAASPAGGYHVTTMGNVIVPNTDRQGGLAVLGGIGEAAASPSISRLVRGLDRPVDLAAGDFDADGETDYVVADFGGHEGHLTLYRGQSGGELHADTLLNEPGAIAVAVVGADLFALMAQGDERIVRIREFASEARSVETLVRFPPSYGSTGLSVLDFDGDGLLDLLYVAGDNADISPVSKPYHGIYVFAGQPDGTFAEALFFHLDGATGASAADFDADGDMDIAAIAYYANPETHREQSGFVYLENDGDALSPRYIEGLSDMGRFIAMSVGDLDGDGDLDIALANLAYGPDGPLKIAPERRRLWAGGPEFALLRNDLH